MVNAARRDQLDARPNGLGSASTNPLLHARWRGGKARRHDGGLELLAGPSIEKGQHVTVDGASA